MITFINSRLCVCRHRSHMPSMRILIAWERMHCSQCLVFCTNFLIHCSLNSTSIVFYWYVFQWPSNYWLSQRLSDANRHKTRCHSSIFCAKFSFFVVFYNTIFKICLTRYRTQSIFSDICLKYFIRHQCDLCDMCATVAHTLFISHPGNILPHFNAYRGAFYLF